MTTDVAPTRAVEVRSRLLEALRLDLVGPDPRLDGEALLAELLPESPSQWYLTGFLAPVSSGADPEKEPRDDDADDDLPGSDADDGGTDDVVASEKPPATKTFFPSSMGLSFLVPGAGKSVHCTVSWGDYTPEPEQGPQRVWKRRANQQQVVVPLEALGKGKPVPIPGSGGLELVPVVRSVDSLRGGGGLPRGTRSVSLFLVNRRSPKEKGLRDAAFAFQAVLEVRSDAPLVARPDPRGDGFEDWDDKVAEIQYADVHEYATGHNVSAEPQIEGEACHVVRTAWLPGAIVDRVEPAVLQGVTLEMEALAALPDADAVAAALGPLVEGYGAWIEQQRKAAPSSGRLGDTARGLLTEAGRARERMVAGLAALNDSKVLDAFRIANRSVATAIRRRNCHGHPDRKPEEQKAPTWRPFQIAFLLLNLPGVVGPEHPDRRVVDLLFFPTGGGKTEAYLGLAALSIALRRLRDPSVRSSGVTILMRYTLRLLTLDQLGRAATLVCALELERQRRRAELGEWPIEIGLWVGQSATPNRMGKRGDDGKSTARAKVHAYRREPARKPSPIPLESCPWCGERFQRDSFDLHPNDDEPKVLRVFCASRACDFWARKQALPLHAVDEPIYRRLPAFLIATVDKFASLPWVGASGALLGRVDRHDDEGFYGGAEPGRGAPMGGFLPPPDLIIQDELHLISGPLGTMAGLYETAIDALCARDDRPGSSGPKIVASTATVRRAQLQIQALFGRPDVAVFPPPGPSRRTSYFAETKVRDEESGRLYVGIGALGRNQKVILMRACLALLTAARKAWGDAQHLKGEENPADPYMTLVGYFNSLRELGGSRRIIEDEVTARVADYADRHRRVSDAPVLFANRRNLTQPRELTSREPTNRVAETKAFLALPWDQRDHVDVVLATNMISVGLDITRLGLMVVTGQPKSAAEYIQATSRVGRDAQRPGLVVTLLNLHRARDRSHFERFATWHASFYRSVEATSVTPFSSRAIDRGLAAVTVAIARHGHPSMVEAKAAQRVVEFRKELGFVADVVANRAQAHAPMEAKRAGALRKGVRDRVIDLLDTWVTIATYRERLQYQREAGDAVPLLRQPLDTGLRQLPTRERKFRAGWSLRDVEPEVKLRRVDNVDTGLGGAGS